MVLLDNVALNFLSGVDATLSANGTLAYFTGAAASRVELVNERGAALSTLPVEPGRYSTVNWSPDGTRLLLQSAPEAGFNLWVYDTASRVTTRLTPDGNAQRGMWTPDGKRVAFMWINRGNSAHWVPADGSTAAEPIPQGAGFSTGFRFSSDGKYIMFYNAAPTDSAQVIVIPMSGGPRLPLLAGVRQPDVPTTSPDGEWMVYSSAESGRREIYIRSFPAGGSRVQVTSNGGSNYALSRDGRRLFYLTPTAVRVATLDFGGSIARLVRTDSLFPNDFRDYAAHPNGREFAVLREASERVKLVVVTNWLDEVMPKLKGAKGP